jgi:predicted branched-subunit amino acid permease
MLYLPWVLGTALGVSVGPLVPPGWEQPLTALFPMLFLVLTVRTCDSRPRALVAGIGALLGVGAALWLPAGLHVPAAGLLAAALGPGLDRLEARAGRAVDG